MNRLLVAVSGGVDSMVLLDMYMKTNNYIEVLHVNHKTRNEENEKDIQLIKEKLKDSGVFLHITEYNHKKGNFQNEARKFRLKTARKILQSRNLDALVYAHHKDDQIENILMNSVKISPKLMSEKSYYGDLLIYRPFLKYWKQDLQEYAELNNVYFNEDSSNKTNKYKRNKVRNINLKYLDKMQKEKIYQKQLESEKKYKKIEVENYLSRKLIENIPHNEARIYVYKLLKNNMHDKNIKTSVVDQVINIAKKEGTKEIQLTAKKKIIISYNDIYVYSKVENRSLYQILLPGENEFNGIKFNNKLNNKGMIRVRRDGDKVKIKNGHKKVSRIFIDKKLEKQQRDIWPIIVDENDEIIWIPKYWKGNYETKK